MAQYIRDLIIFENRTTVSQLIEVWDKQDLGAPKDCDISTTWFDKDPTHVTVSELNMFRKKLCGEFWPRLSEYASHFLHNCKHFSIITPSSTEHSNFSIDIEEVYMNKSKLQIYFLFHD